MASGKISTAIVAKAATALTTAYASGWASDTIDVKNLDQIRLYFAFVHSAATEVKLLLQFSTDKGTTWFDDYRTSNGTVTKNEQTLAVSADASFALAVGCSDYTHVRVQALGTSADGSDTLALSYSGGVSR